jgi:putative ABC transport system permease protein
MIAYSLGFRALSGRPNIAYSSGVPTVFTVLAPLKPIVGPIISDLITGAICTLVVSVGIWVLFSSEVGLVIRAAGTNATLLKHMGHQSSLYQALGLAASNGLVALSAVLVSAREGYADIGSGIGIVVTLIASLVLGEQLIGTVRSTSVKRIAGPLIGTFAYYLLFLIVLRASLRGWIPFQIYPTDLRLMSAVVLVISLVLRGAKSRAPQTEEIIPL